MLQENHNESFVGPPLIRKFGKESREILTWVFRMRRSAEALLACSSASICCSIAAISNKMDYQKAPPQSKRSQITMWEKKKRNKKFSDTFEFPARRVGRLLDVGHELLQLFLVTYRARHIQYVVELLQEMMRESLRSSVVGADKMMLCFCLTDSTSASTFSIAVLMSSTYREKSIMMSYFSRALFIVSDYKHLRPIEKSGRISFLQGGSTNCRKCADYQVVVAGPTWDVSAQTISCDSYT